jgi:putative nucleotidyltransferase with HDIG domain
MPSPGSAGLIPVALLREPVTVRASADWLREARDQEQAGLVPQAISSYERAIAAAEAQRESRVLVEALRGLAVARHRRGECAQARAICRRSYRLAREQGADVLAAEALNTLGAMALERGALKKATRTFRKALELGETSCELRARVEQNLGILANIRGELEEALARYRASLEAYRRADNEHGCAIAYHNLGMVSADRGLFKAADHYFEKSRALAARRGDARLQALCLVNKAEADVARQRFQDARQDAEAALALFDQLGERRAKADAYRVIGMVYRETGRPELAEARLRSAIELAAGAGAPLNEAEALRELALLYQAMGRNHEALRSLNAAHRLFQRLDACADLIHVGGKVAELESTYLAVVRAWGRSLESRDGSTFGHCGRVARLAVATARELGLDEHEETTILLGAYLHDLGKIGVPPDVLHKPGSLTPEERAIVQMHPVWGISLLADVEFPWDIKPIIRWHHEKYDGSGYPDGLRGDAIPISAQIVGIAEVFDALTTDWGHQAALPVERALERITGSRHWWSERVVEAFLRAMAASSRAPAGDARGALSPSARIL